MSANSDSCREQGVVVADLFLWLEIPMSGRDARRRHLPANVSKMTVGTKADSRFPALLEELLRLWRPDGKQILIRAENEFCQLAELEVSEETVFLDPDRRAVRAVSARGAVSALSAWKAEAHTLFFGDEETLRRIVLDEPTPRFRLRPLAPSDDFQREYIRHLEVADPFLFIGQGHSSVEVIGSKRRILSCFDSVRPFIVGDEVLSE